jgi:hypothetical protein
MPFGVNDYDSGSIQGRNRARSGLITALTPGISLNGCILYLDAANLASFPSVNGGTYQQDQRWFNIGGDDTLTNATFTNDPAGDPPRYDTSLGYGGTIGTTEFAIIYSQLLGGNNLRFNNVTLIAWVIMGSFGPLSDAGVLMGSGAAWGLKFRGTTGQVGYIWPGTASSNGFVTGFTPAANQPVMMALTINPARASFYFGNSSGFSAPTPNTASHNTRVVDDSLYIGGGINNFEGFFSQVLMYTRALSREEIFQFYSATRARYRI